MMRKQPSDSSSEWQSLEIPWDWYFSILLGSLLLFLPFSLGVVEPWSELVVVAAAVALCLGLIARVWLDPTFRLVRSWSYLPLTLIVFLIVVQLLPLPRAVVGLVSGKSIELRQNLLGSLFTAEEGWTTLSLYPYETAHDLRMALVFIVVFVAVASVFQSKQQIKRALWGVFLLGCVEAVVAVLQILTLSPSIHWMYASQSSVVTSGSFINYSHFCQFMNLALGAGVAIVLVRMKEDGRRDRGQISRLVDLRGDRYLRPLTGIVLCVVVVLTSMSRNGVISLLLAAGVIAVALYRKGVLSTRGWLLAIVPWAVVLLVFLTSFDKVYERLATLEEQGSFEGRLEMTTATLQAWQDFPVLGTGLGTHEYVFPLYDTAINPRMAEHADNDWAQLLEEFGLLGAGAVVAFVLSVAAVAIQLMLNGKTSLSTAVFGLSFGLLATAWHSLSDFGQHLPGVFVLTATVSGLILSVARYERRKTREAGTTQGRYQNNWQHLGLVRTPVSLAALAFCGWSALGAFRAYQADAWAASAFGMEQRITSEAWRGDEQDFVDLLIAAEAAAEVEPSNVRHGYLLNLYRWRFMSQERDPESQEILLDQNGFFHVSRIVEELAQLRRICPVFGPIYGLEGELRNFVLDDESGKQLISAAARLTPFHADTNFVAGQLAASEARWEDATKFFGRAADLEPRMFQAVASSYVDQFDRADLAEALAGANYYRLKVLASLLKDSESQDASRAETAERLNARAIDLLRQLVRSGQANANQIYTLATVELDAGSREKGITLLRRALTHDFGRKHWRLLLARTLLEEGKLEEAQNEAQIVLRLDRRSKQAAELVQQLKKLRTD